VPPPAPPDIVIWEVARDLRSLVVVQARLVAVHRVVDVVVRLLQPVERRGAGLAGLLGGRVWIGVGLVAVGGGGLGCLRTAFVGFI
jgi:hypothetical protein